LAGRHGQDADDARGRVDQTLEDKVYSEIIMTRVTVPVVKTSVSAPRRKNDPWMGALDDNLDVLNKTDDGRRMGPRRRARSDSIADPENH
jgi:predicted ribonuclease YlaK